MDEFDVILKEIAKKLQEKGDNASAAVIQALIGARIMGDQQILGEHVMKLVEDVLKPKAQLKQRGLDLN